MMEELFDFSEALRRLKAGEKVTRKIWGGHWVMVKGKLHRQYPGMSLSLDVPLEVHTLGYTILAVLKDGGCAPAQPYQADLLATDWMVYTK